MLLTVFQVLTGDVDGIGWPIVHQLICVAGALLTAVAIRTHTRRTAARRPFRSSASGRWATGLAIGAPLCYGAIRWSWALGYLSVRPRSSSPRTPPPVRV